MTYLAIGAAILTLLVWLGRGSTASRREMTKGAWRVAGGMTALVVLIAASFVMMRGGWGKGAALLALGLVLALGARWPRPVLRRPQGPAPAPGRSMSVAEARAMLGVDEKAGPDEIDAAYKRLMMRVHPDQGGASGLAAQVNAARDVLMRK
jgi:hypothetical protein